MYSRAVAVAALALAACAESPSVTAPHVEPSFAVTVLDRSNTREPFNITLLYTCSPPSELVHLSGTLHTTSNMFVDGNGTTHWSFHSHPVRVLGVGAVSGREFRVLGSESTTRRIEEDNNRTFRQTATLRLQAPGEPAWIMRFHILREGTPGNWTYTFDKSEVACQQ